LRLEWEWVTRGKRNIIERFFRTLKTRLRGVSRSMKVAVFTAFSSLFFVFYNFIRYHRGIKRIPCDIKEAITCLS
jgi:transposase-like protein